MSEIETISTFPLDIATRMLGDPLDTSLKDAGRINPCLWAEIVAAEHMAAKANSGLGGGDIAVLIACWKMMHPGEVPFK